MCNYKKPKEAAIYSALLGISTTMFKEYNSKHHLQFQHSTL